MSASIEERLDRLDRMEQRVAMLSQLVDEASERIAVTMGQARALVESVEALTVELTDERIKVNAALGVLRDAFGHADAPYTPAALNAIRILEGGEPS